MGSHAYLCVLEEPRVCPVFASASTHPRCAIAHAKYAVPVLWALLFEASDLAAAEHVDEEGESVRCWAPVSTTERALEVLHANAAKLTGVLGPALGGYVELLRDELRVRGSTYVTVDVFDLVAMSDRDELRPVFEALYRELDALTSPPPARRGGLRGLFARPPKVLEHLTSLSGVRPGAGLLDARCLVTSNGLTEAGLENHWAMLGSQYQGPVAWDPGEPIHGTAREVIAAMGAVRRAGS